MKRSSTTKKALFISTCALLFSMLMMAGSTFAWFTDSVSSGTNTITTGKLNVQLLHTNQKVTEAKEVQQNTLLFTDKEGKSIDWEPGAVAYENFTVKNSGDLALNYRLALDLNNANTIAGTTKSLKDVLKVKVLDHEVTSEDVKEQALKNAEDFVSVTDGQISIPTQAKDPAEQKLLQKGSEGDSSKTYGVIVYWQPDPEKDYEYNLSNYPDKNAAGKPIDKTSDGKTELSIDLGVSLGATQAPEESDSNGSDYDKNAIYPVSNKGELEKALQTAEKGDVVELTGNITLTAPLPITKDVTIRSVGGAAISGEAFEVSSSADVTLQGVTFKAPRTSDNQGVSLKASEYAGKLILQDCTFEEPQWSSVVVTATASADITIKGCTFDAKSSAGHKDDSTGSSALTKGAHQVMKITGESGTKLALTGNTFTGLKECHASSSVVVSGISANGMICEKNTADETAKISIANNGSLKGFAKK